MLRPTVASLSFTLAAILASLPGCAADPTGDASSDEGVEEVATDESELTTYGACSSWERGQFRCEGGNSYSKCVALDASGQRYAWAYFGACSNAFAGGKRRCQGGVRSWSGAGGLCTVNTAGDLCTQFDGTLVYSGQSGCPRSSGYVALCSGGSWRAFPQGDPRASGKCNRY